MAAETPTIAEAARLIAASELSPVDLTRAMLDRIAGLDGRLHAFATVDGDRAMDAARAAEAEILSDGPRGPLHGIPVALKDAIDTAGLRTTVSSRLLADRVPDADADCWARLRAAGAVLLGKLENTEFCLGGPARDGFLPHARNPWDPGRYAGGSSSGAGVAVAAGMCPGAIGTDTGGSVRIPAAFCGIAGHKPTYELVSRTGVFPLSWSLDHVGPMAWTAEDCALLLDAVAASGPRDHAAALTEELAGVRVGYAADWDRHCVDPEVPAAARAALDAMRGLGAEVVEVEMPDLWAFTACNSTIMMSEAYAIHEAWLRKRPGDYSAFTRERIAMGALLRAADYAQAQRLRRELIAATDAATAGVDAWVTVGMIGPPPRIDQVEAFYFLEVPLITCPANVTGTPSTSVRCGFSAGGLPLSIQIGAARGRDATALRVAHAYERATPEHARRPPV